VVSTAVEAQVPDVAAARRAAIPVVHRSELLARFVSDARTIAVAGTSGKSTVVAMVFEILRGAGADPSVITGGELLAWSARDCGATPGRVAALRTAGGGGRRERWSLTRYGRRWA
jgi:UDP-N-acetylmuramate-alanine ligase